MTFRHTFNAAHAELPFRKFGDPSEMWMAIQIDLEYFGLLGEAFVAERNLDKPRERKMMFRILRKFDEKVYSDDAALCERQESKENICAIPAKPPLPQCKPHNEPGNPRLSNHYFYMHLMFDVAIAAFPFFYEALSMDNRKNWTPKKFAESLIKIGKGTWSESGSDRLAQRGHLINNFNKDKETARSFGVDLSAVRLYVDYDCGESDLDAQRHCAVDSMMLATNSEFKALQAVRADPEVMKRLVTVYTTIFPDIKLEANCAATEVFFLPSRLHSMRNESRNQRRVSKKPYTEAELVEFFGDANNMHAYYLVGRTPEIVAAFKTGIEEYVKHLEFKAGAARMAADIQKEEEQAERECQQLIEAAKSKRDAVLSEVQVKKDKLEKELDKHKVPPFLTAPALEQAPSGSRQQRGDHALAISRIFEQKTIAECYS
jgi:hypothetical protein